MAIFGGGVFVAAAGAALHWRGPRR
jgi:hypothetical protein